MRCQINYSPLTGEVESLVAVNARQLLESLVRQMMEDGGGSFVRDLLWEEVVRYVPTTPPSPPSTPPSPSI